MDKTFDLGSGDKLEIKAYPFGESFSTREAKLLVKALRTPKLLTKEEKPKIASLKVALSKKPDVKFLVTSVTVTEYLPAMLAEGKRPRGEGGETNFSMA